MNEIPLVEGPQIPASYIVYKKADGLTYAKAMLENGMDYKNADLGMILNSITVGPIHIKAGTYDYSTGIIQSVGNISYVGDGRDATILNYTGTGTAFTSVSKKTRIEKLTLKTSTGAVGFDLSAPFDSIFCQLATSGFSTAGLKFKGNANNAGIFNSFLDNIHEDPTRLAMDDVTNTINNNLFNSIRFIGSCQLGISSFNPTGIVFTNCGFNPLSGPGFINYGNGTILQGCDSELAGSTTTIDNESGLGRMTIIGGYYSNDNSTGLEGMGIVNNGNELFILNCRASTVLYVGSIVGWRLNNSSPYFQFAEGAIGSGSAALSTNCPAITVTAPYTWVKVKSSDGSTVYLPAWK